MISVLNTTSKYLLSIFEASQANQGDQGGAGNATCWKNKASTWIFFIDLTAGGRPSPSYFWTHPTATNYAMSDFSNLMIYLVYFATIVAFYGLPLNIVRDVYITARSFVTRLYELRKHMKE